VSGGDGNGNTVAGLFKALLTSPVGGWALAVILVGFMAYLTFKDRQSMYQDVVRLRENAMPLIRESNDMAKQILTILREKHQ
jgi:hypothetical protein